jgi:predicted GNAT family acetyltransferase
MDTVRHNTGKRRFEVEQEGRLSVVDYQLREGRMIITHTFVPTELRGKGIAEKLVSTALEFARSESFGVVSQCSYVSTYLRRHPEDADLLVE